MADTPSTVLISCIFTVTLLLVLLIGNIYRFRRRSDETAALESVLFISLAGAIVDPLTYAINYFSLPFAQADVFIGHTILYLSYLIVPLLWIDFLRIHLNIRFSRGWNGAMLAPFAVGIIMLFLNLYLNIIFVVDEHGSFHRGPLFAYYFAAFTCYIVIGIVMYARALKHFVYRFFPVWQFSIPMIMGIVLQFLQVGYATIWAFMAIALVEVFTSLKNEEIYRDQMTRLYSRTFLDYLKKRIHTYRGKKITGVLFDLDGFKKVNDEFGHLEGDNALIHAASVLRDTVGTDGTVIRYAGDEFIALLITDEEIPAEEMRQRVEDAFSAFNENSNLPYQLHASMGFCTISPTAGGIDEFINEADKRMYVEKRRYYEQVGYDRRKNYR